jgi:hypothetical protein
LRTTDIYCGKEATLNATLPISSIAIWKRRKCWDKLERKKGHKSSFSFIVSSFFTLL